jgi:hypothetical protein
VNNTRDSLCKWLCKGLRLTWETALFTLFPIARGGLANVNVEGSNPFTRS